MNNDKISVKITYEDHEYLPGIATVTQKDRNKAFLKNLPASLNSFEFEKIQNEAKDIELAWVPKNKFF